MTNASPVKTEIRTAFENWEKAENNIPDQEYDPKYKNRSATARKMWRLFTAICKENGLQPVSIAQELKGAGNFIVSLKK